MAIKRFSSNFKTRDDVFDSITPNNMVQPNIAAPAGEWKPARYLPVQWTGSASKDAFVISSGKVVCFDTQGRIADMVLKAACAAATGNPASAQIIVYDSTDEAYGVYNIATGAPCSAGDIVNIDDLAQGLIDQGLVVFNRDFTSADLAGTYFDASQLQDCQAICDAFWSDPVGVAAYDVYVWAGDTPDELVFTNYQKQHLVQFITQAQMRAPVIAAATATTGIAPSTGTARTVIASTSTVSVAAGDYVTGANLRALARYSSVVNTEILGIILVDHGGAVAKNTDRTPLTEAASFALVSEKSSIEQLGTLGDYFLDHEVGVLVIYADGGDYGNPNGPAQADMQNLSVFAKAGAAAQYRHIHIEGPVRPGDKLGYDAQSNFVKAGSANDVSGGLVLGRVLEVSSLPKGLLDRVTTAFTGSSFDATAQMPGSATKGYSDMITLSAESVADEIATINLKV